MHVSQLIMQLGRMNSGLASHSPMLAQNSHRLFLLAHGRSGGSGGEGGLSGEGEGEGDEGGEGGEGGVEGGDGGEGGGL
jgi:hypothetical protein